jgi:hypothetical protein
MSNATSANAADHPEAPGQGGVHVLLLCEFRNLHERILKFYRPPKTGLIKKVCLRLIGMSNIDR